MKSKILKIILPLFALLLIGFSVSLSLVWEPGQASAQPAVQPVPPAPNPDEGFVPCGNKFTEPCTVGHLFKGFIVIINYLIVMAGFVAVLAIVYSGLTMVWSRGDEGGLKTAKGRLSGAVIGMVIVAAAFVLINALFSGSLSIGVCNGSTILTDPRTYIQGNSQCN